MTSNNDMVNVLSKLKCNSRSIWNSTRCVYLHLLESITGPEIKSEKKQLKWANELHINNTFVNWIIIYGSNFPYILEPK